MPRIINSGETILSDFSEKYIHHDCKLLKHVNKRNGYATAVVHTERCGDKWWSVTNGQDVILEINYCPFCGKSLKFHVINAA